MEPFTHPSSNFAISTGKTPREIQLSCEMLEAQPAEQLSIKHNGNHIWLEIAEEKQHYWSPLLHLEMTSLGEKGSFVQGEVVQNPITWAILLAFRMGSLAIMAAAFSALYYKAFSGQSFDTELIIILSVGGALSLQYLLSLYNRRKRQHQLFELKKLMETIVN